VPYNAEKKIMARLKDYLEASRAALAATIDGVDEARIERAIAAITSALSKDKPLLICGNGGSAADAMHIAGELVGRYLKERRGLKAIALSSDPAVLTAWSNDYGYDTVFARQVEALGAKGGVLLAISTSGNSKNVILAAKAAKKKGMMVVGLTGKGGGKLGTETDILLDVPATATPLIQQIHICLYHFMCSEIEERISRA